MPTNTKALQVAEPSQFVAGKNKILNGDFSVWQRGTTISSTSGTLLTSYLADRWSAYYFGGGNTANYTMSQQAQTPAAIPGCETQYFIRHAFPAGNATTYWEWQNRIEDVRTLAGQQIAFSFWAKSTGTQQYPTIEVQQNFGSGGSATAYTYIGAQTFTSSWARYTYTTTLPSISGKTIGAGSYLQFKLYFGPTPGIVTAFNLDIAGMQLEAGSVATPFTTATGTLQGELAACQRYFWRLSGAAPYSNQFVCQTAARSASTSYGTIKLPVSMRSAPTFTSASGTNYFEWVFSASFLENSIVAQTLGTDVVAIKNNTVTGFTAGQGGELNFNSTSAYLDFSAEL